MTDTPVAAHARAEAHTDAGAKPAESHSWAGDFVSSIWGAAKIVGHVAAGAAHEVIEHPGKTAAEVAAGVGLAVAATELGIGVAAGAAAGAVVLAGYGAYKAVEIAATEGVGAIPGHMRHAYEDAKHSAENVMDAASTIYHGETGAKADKASATLEGVGREAVPFVAAAVGGAGNEVGQMALRGGARAMADILPPLILQPAYAGVPARAAAAAVVTSGAASAEQIGLAAGTAGTAMAMTKSGEGGGGESRPGEPASDYDRQQHFIEGKPGPAPIDGPAGPGAQIADGFKNVDSIIKNGGQRGFLKFHDDGGGWYSVEITEGKLAGRTGIWQKGSPNCQFEGLDGMTHEFPVK